MTEIWNEIVEKGNAFPQEELLTPESGAVFFAEQTYTGVAVDTETEKIYGLYILHPNQKGFCMKDGHYKIHYICVQDSYENNKEVTD